MPAKGKKFSKSYTDSKTGRKRTVSYGAKGYSISPGTSKGDNYCARSYGINKQAGYDCSGKDKNKPNCLSRSKWHCKGKKSVKESLPHGFDRHRTTIVKCREGWIYVRPTSGGSNYLVSGSGQKSTRVDASDLHDYVEELSHSLGGYVKHTLESTDAQRVVNTLLESA